MILKYIFPVLISVTGVVWGQRTEKIEVEVTYHVPPDPAKPVDFNKISSDLMRNANNVNATWEAREKACNDLHFHTKNFVSSYKNKSIIIGLNILQMNAQLKVSNGLDTLIRKYMTGLCLASSYQKYANETYLNYKQFVDQLSLIGESVDEKLRRFKASGQPNEVSIVFLEKMEQYFAEYTIYYQFLWRNVKRTDVLVHQKFVFSKIVKKEVDGKLTETSEEIDLSTFLNSCLSFISTYRP